MSKNRVIVLSITNQNLTIREVSEKYAISERRIYQLLAKYRKGGIAAIEPQPRTPKTNPRTTPQELVETITSLWQSLAEQGLDNGAHTIAWHLEQKGLKPPAVSTIWRILKNAGLVQPQPKKKPRSYIQRFQADQPNETWQSDFTHWRLADGTDIEILNWLDDQSRFLLSCKAFKPVTGVDVVETFKECANEHGLPASTLTDNGSVYTARFVKGTNQFGKLTLRRKGTIHHLGIGIKNAGIPVMILVDETDVTVTHIRTGEIISTHIIDDNHNYWPKQQGR